MTETGSQEHPIKTEKFIAQTNLQDQAFKRKLQAARLQRPLILFTFKNQEY